MTGESYRVEGNSLSRFIRAVAKSKNILSNLSQQLCFMFALMFHIRGIAIRQLFPHLKEVGVCRIAIVANIRGILN